MPNRILKETICTSDNIDRLSAFEETVFYRLMVNCDDFGRMDGRAKILAARLFPLKEIPADQVAESMRALALADLVTLYEVDGKPYVQMTTWDKHQSVRAIKSKYPSPDDGTITEVASDCKQLQADESNCKQAQANVPVFDNSIRESNTNTKTKTRVRPREEDPRFTQFWAAYPRHTAKAEALKAFKKIDPDDELLLKMLSAIQQQRNSSQWTRDNGQYIPHPATWLNQRRWEDEPMQKPVDPWDALAWGEAAES